MFGQMDSYFQSLSVTGLYLSNGLAFNVCKGVILVSGKELCLEILHKMCNILPNRNKNDIT